MVQLSGTSKRGSHDYPRLGEARRGQTPRTGGKLALGGAPAGTAARPESRGAGSHFLLEGGRGEEGCWLPISSCPAARVLLPGAPSRVENGPGDEDQPPLAPSWGLFSHSVASSSLAARKGDGEASGPRLLCSPASPAELRGP